jgi:hypothetical protein
VFFSERVPDRTLRQERALIYFSFFFFSERWDPLWGKRGRYKQKWRGDVEQFRPNRFGMGWQVFFF